MNFKKNFLNILNIKNSIEKPIFIVGPPRTGTTITYATLCAHPDLAWFSTYDIEYFVPKEIVTLIKNGLSPEPFNHEFQYMINGPDKPGPNLSCLPPGLQPVEGNSLWNRIFEGFPDDISKDAKKEIRKVISDTIKRQNKLRFLNKSPLHSTRLFILKNIFPDAKFINLIREPRATIASSLKRHEQAEEGFAANYWPIKNKSKFEKFDLIQKYALLYAEVVDSTYEFLKFDQGKNFMTIIYEELMKNQTKTLLKILNFCELSIPNSLEDMIPPFYETSDKWKERFSFDDQKKIFDIVQPSLQKMNYQYKI